MKRTIVMVAALVAGLAVGASAQVKVKPGVGPGKGSGVGHATPVGGKLVSPKPSGATTGTAGKTAKGAAPQTGGQ